MKTLQECKDEVANKYGIAKFEMAKVFRSQSYEKMLDEAAKLYASEACREQREICAAHYNHYTKDTDISILFKIKNAPEPTLS
jgi:broad-specificity NMP kinase